MQPLTVSDHDRDRVGLTYVYPVLSRRSGGLSVGINLNPNNRCNWACIYCQVPGLRRGAAPSIDLTQLEHELSGFIDTVLHGDFYDRHRVPLEQRAIRDIAVSGNGEATSAKDFDAIIALIARVAERAGLIETVKLVLISNGSLVHHAQVQSGLRELAKWNGELWFKLDAATDAGLRQINQTSFSELRARRHLDIAARLCPTWLQTCVFRFDGDAVLERVGERNAYLDFLADLVQRQVPVKGVLVYGLARPSMQPQAARLSPVSDASMDRLAEKIAELGLQVKVSR